MGIDNQRQLFVQTPAIGISLKEFVQREDNKPWVIQKILRSLTEGLSGLHQGGITHGDISPQSVCVTENKTAILMLPDFSRPDVDPSRSWYTSDAGLEFRAPEQDQTQAPIPASDLFSLGLLFIWIHLPNMSMERNQKGVPVLNDLQISEDVRYTAQALLCSDPSSRVRAGDILQTGYFQNIIPDLLHVESGSDSTSPDRGDSEEIQCIEMNETGEDLVEVRTSPSVDSTEVTSSAPEEVDSSQEVNLSQEAISSEEVYMSQEVNSSQEVVNPTPEGVSPTPEGVSPMADLVPEQCNSPENTPLPLEKDTMSLEDRGDNPDTSLENRGDNTDTSLENRGDNTDTSFEEKGDNPLTSTPLDSVDNSTEETLIEMSAQTDSGNTEQQNDLGAGVEQFNISQSTIDSLLSMSAELGPRDGSGDSQENVNQPARVEPIDNATLIENLLSFTVPNQSKNLSF